MNACTVKSDRSWSNVASSIASSNSRIAAMTAVNCWLPALPPASNRLILIIMEAKQRRLRRNSERRLESSASSDRRQRRGRGRPSREVGRSKPGPGASRGAVDRCRPHREGRAGSRRARGRDDGVIRIGDGEGVVDDRVRTGGLCGQAGGHDRRCGCVGGRTHDDVELRGGRVAATVRHRAVDRRGSDRERGAGRRRARRRDVAVDQQRISRSLRSFRPRDP